MSKTVLAELNGFTPVIDDLVIEMGAVCALVFGKVWRYCQMKNGVCTASQQTIADELGLSRKCINENVQRLVAAGYLEETDKPGVTKTYRDTGKAGVKFILEGSASKDTCNPKLQVEPEPVTQSYNTCNPELHVPVTQSYTKIDSKKESKKEIQYEEEPVPDEKFSEMQHICERLIGRLGTPADIPTIELFIREGVIEEDIKSALAWRKKENLRPVSLLRQLEAGVLRNKATRAQNAAAATAPPPANFTRPQALSTLEKSLAAGKRAMQKALAEEEANLGNKG